MISMDMFLQMSVYLWISAGFLSLPEKSVAHHGKSSFTPCQFVFRNVCFEFVGGSKTWSEAKKSCEIQGGELLKMMNSPIEMFLKNMTRERNTGNFTWWLGEGVQGEYQQPTLDINDTSKDRCTYMTLNHLQLITTSDCSQRRGFLCTYNPSDVKILEEHKHTMSSRLKRSVEAMKMNVSNIKGLVVEAENELKRMELESGEPTNDNRDKFIQYLLEGTKKLSPKFALENNVTIGQIINCSSGILLLSMKKCDSDTNPNPTALFEQVFEIFRTISVLIGKNLETEMVIKHPTGTIYQKSFPTEKLGNTVLGSKKDGEFVQFPSFGTFRSKLNGQNNIIAQLATFSNNPHPSDDNITGSVFSILLNNGVSDIKLDNLAEMIEIYLPRPNASAATNNTILLEKNTQALTTLNVTDPNVTIFITVEPNTNASLLLVLTYGSPPNSTYQGNTTVLSTEGGYRWMITPELLQGNTGDWYVEISLFNSTWVPGLTLRISTFVTKCMFWDIEMEIWSTGGCQVGIESTPELTQCLCNHLTLFGSSFFVMPNHVDLSRTAELFTTVTKNYVVLALLCAFFGLYLVTLMWACYADRKAHSKQTITLLEDNHPGAQYNYLVSIQTGHRKNAGTSANVTVKLIGSEAESDTHNLTDPDKPVFERGAVDMFLLATPFPLGEVRNLRLQHDNSGGHPSWYINKVTIQDLQTRYVFHFFCDCWLSTDRGDGMMKKTFNAAKNNEIASFRNIFQTRTSTGFRDEHIWVSIVDPPSRSPFTRAQRVSCCMSLLLCTMAINIAFWNIPIDESSPVLLSIGSIRITWQEIMVGVQSGLLMFPINILIITIFRSIKPRIVSKQHKHEEDVTPQAVSIPTILKDTEEVITMVSRSPRNKISLTQRLVSTVDLCPALENIHEFIQIMQGETNSDTHWVYCSKFLLCGLCHLLFCLEKLEGRNFPTYEYHHVLSTINLLVRKSEMVYSSHLAYCPPPPKIKRKRRTASGWLPWWCVFLGWFLLLSISGVSTFFTLLYGFEYGREKSIKWVMSLGLSLFQSIFILQPLKVIGIAVFFALLLKPVAIEETEEIEQVLLAQQDKCRRYSGRETL